MKKIGIILSIIVLLEMAYMFLMPFSGLVDCALCGRAERFANGGPCHCILSIVDKSYDFSFIIFYITGALLIITYLVHFINKKQK